MLIDASSIGSRSARPMVRRCRHCGVVLVRKQRLLRGRLVLEMPADFAARRFCHRGHYLLWWHDAFDGAHGAVTHFGLDGLGREDGALISRPPIVERLRAWRVWDQLTEAERRLVGSPPDR